MPLFDVTLTMVESRRYREESETTFVVSGPDEASVRSYVEHLLQGEPEEVDFIGELEWIETRTEPVGADVVENPEIASIAKKKGRKKPFLLVPANWSPKQPPEETTPCASP
ncbi:MAG: hypothetical protein L0312_20190 [Acidobacteria bacterium]|nr:hypothetical protein [Acidobacteriota bacterium]